MDRGEAGDVAAIVVLVIAGTAQLAWWGLRRLAGQPWPMADRTSDWRAA